MMISRTDEVGVGQKVKSVSMTMEVKKCIVEVQPNIRRAVWCCGILVAFMLAACDRAPAARGSDPAAGGSDPAAGGFDFRRLAAEREQFVGTEQICAVTFVANAGPQSVTASDHRYENAFYNAVSWLPVKCGVAQLVVDFARETANEALAIQSGQRIRVRIGHQTYGGRPVALYVGRD